jgi:DNA adenine methylase
MAAEPFLRWAGGKRQLLSLIHAALPADFDLSKHRFFEPFVGGGAVMLSLDSHPSGAAVRSSKKKRPRIVVNDVNEELIATYRALQNHVDDVVSLLKTRAVGTSEADFYNARDHWTPTTGPEVAARMIYLNRLAFNGLYRVRADGAFNVPYGKIKNPTVCNESRLRDVADWLSFVEIRSGSFIAALNDAREGDVVYLDPPYLPLTPTSSFSKYAKDDFREMEHGALKGAIERLTERGARVILSNSNTELTRDIFSDVVDLRVVSVSRSISAAAGSRTRVEEVLGLNYPIADAYDPAVVGALPQA